jgi:hypothetical protein
MSQHLLNATHMRRGNEVKCFNTLTKHIIKEQFYKTLTTPSKQTLRQCLELYHERFLPHSLLIHYSLIIQHPRYTLFRYWQQR